MKWRQYKNKYTLLLIHKRTMHDLLSFLFTIFLNVFRINSMWRWMFLVCSYNYLNSGRAKNAVKQAKNTNWCLMKFTQKYFSLFLFMFFGWFYDKINKLNNYIHIYFVNLNIFILCLLTFMMTNYYMKFAGQLQSRRKTKRQKRNNNCVCDLLNCNYFWRINQYQKRKAWSTHAVSNNNKK